MMLSSISSAQQGAAQQLHSSPGIGSWSWYKIQIIWILGLFFIQSTDDIKQHPISLLSVEEGQTAKQQLDDNVWSHHVPAAAAIASAVAAALLQLMLLLLCCCFFYCCYWYCCSCCCCRLCCCWYRCCCYCCCCCSCCCCWWSGQAAAVKRWIHLSSTYSE